MLALLASVTLVASVRTPAEFEPQSAVWLSWPRYDNKLGYPVKQVHRAIVKALAGNTPVRMLVKDDAEIAEARRYLAKRAGVRFVKSPNNEIWVRDFGPIFVERNGSPAIADFRFNYWGYLPTTDPASRAEEGVDRLVAKTLGYPVVRSSLISEGGNREFDGQGTMIAVEAVEQQRNPGMELAEIEREFRRVFGVTQVIWLKRGGMEDDFTFDGPLPDGTYTVITTGGHVDNVARFANARTILLAEVSEEQARRSHVSRESRRRFEENFQILRAARDGHGRPYRIVRMPTPDPIVTTMRPGDAVYDFMSELKYRKPFPKGRSICVTEAASTMNFLISNGVVLTGRFYRPGRSQRYQEQDRRSQAILRKEFPGRRIVAIDCEAVNLGGGGIHCITQQQPRIGNSLAR